MKKLCFVFCFFLFLSCNEQIIEHSETIIEKSEYQLSIEDVKSIALDFFDIETKSSEAIKVVSYKMQDYTLPTVQTKSYTLSSEKVPVYELITESKGQYGYSVVIGDRRISKVLISVMNGALSDTVYNEPLRMYFNAIPEIIYGDLVAFIINQLIKIRQ